jgi:hypothetical protein
MLHEQFNLNAPLPEGLSPATQYDPSPGAPYGWLKDTEDPRGWRPAQRLRRRRDRDIVPQPPELPARGKTPEAVRPPLPGEPVPRAAKRRRGGRYDPQQAMRDAQAVQMRAIGWNDDQIARYLGYPGGRQVRSVIRRQLDMIPVENVDYYRQLESIRLDDASVRIYQILNRKQYIISPRGELIRSPDTGQYLLDDDVQIRAIEALRRISESKRRLLGIDAPVHGEAPYDNKILDAQILETMAELKAAAKKELMGGDVVEAEIISDKPDGDDEEGEEE